MDRIFPGEPSISTDRLFLPSSSTPSNGACLIPLPFEQGDPATYPSTVIPTWITLSTINFILVSPICVINLLVIWTILEDEDLRSVTYNLLLAILAATDFLVGFVVAPLEASVFLCSSKGCSFPCPLFVTTTLSGMICISWSLCILSVLCVERYLLIEHEQFYSTYVTKKKMAVATALMLILTTPITVSSTVGVALGGQSAVFNGVSTTVIFTLFVVIIVYCTGKVNLTAIRHQRAINAQVVAAQGAQSEQDRLKEIKRCFAMGMMVAGNFLLTIPIIIISIIGKVHGIGVTPDYQFLAVPICCIFINLQSMVNPIVFSLRLSYIRNGVKRKVIKLMATKNNVVPTGQEQEQPESDPAHN